MSGSRLFWGSLSRDPEKTTMVVHFGRFSIHDVPTALPSPSAGEHYQSEPFRGEGRGRGGTPPVFHYDRTALLYCFQHVNVISSYSDSSSSMHLLDENIAIKRTLTLGECELATRRTIRPLGCTMTTKIKIPKVLHHFWIVGPARGL